MSLVFHQERRACLAAWNWRACAHTVHTQSAHAEHTHTHIAHRERMLLCGERRLPLTLRNAMEVCEASEEFHNML